MQTRLTINRITSRRIGLFALACALLVVGAIIFSGCSPNASAEPRTGGIPLGGAQESQASKENAASNNNGEAGQAYAGLPSPTDRAQISNGGNVSIEVIWKGPQPSNNEIELDVGMNTHSVDLDDIDLSKLAILRNDKGQEFAPAAWDSAPGGHHRRGTLLFPLTANGKSVIEKDTKYVELVICDVAGVPERVIHWDLKVKS